MASTLTLNKDYYTPEAMIEAGNKVSPSIGKYLKTILALPGFTTNGKITLQPGVGNSHMRVLEDQYLEDRRAIAEGRETAMICLATNNLGWVFAAKVPQSYNTFTDRDARDVSDAINRFRSVLPSENYLQDWAEGLDFTEALVEKFQELDPNTFMSYHYGSSQNIICFEKEIAGPDRILQAMILSSEWLISFGIQRGMPRFPVDKDSEEYGLE